MIYVAIFLFVFAVCYMFASISVVLNVGKPREPLEAKNVAGGLVIKMLVVFALVACGLVVLRG